MTTIFALSLLPGCETAAPPQLENFEVVSADEVADVGTFSASAAVTAIDGNRDFHFTLTSSEGIEDVTFDLHSPGASPLDTLNGLDLQFTFDDGWDSYNLLIHDDEGLVYAVNDGGVTAEIESYFGREIVTEGASVANFREDGKSWDYYLIDVATDGGTISLLPGEAEVVWIDGVSYRVVAIAAYHTDLGVLGGLLGPDCGGTDLLSYEIMRVAPETKSEVLERASELPEASSGCG